MFNPPLYLPAVVCGLRMVVSVSIRFRGAKLKAEVERICTFNRSKGDWKYPYGWSEQDLTGPMRRMFGLNRKPNLAILDEFWSFVQ